MFVSSLHACLEMNKIYDFREQARLLILVGEYMRELAENEVIEKPRRLCKGNRSDELAVKRPI